MTHDVEELRAGLRAQAEKPDFTVSLDGVRRRAGRQRTRRAVVVSVVAVVAALALAVPLALLKFGDSTPTADLSKDQLPRPEQGWRIVDDPISTGARGLADNFETVLWFTQHGDGTIRLNEGIYDPASDRVRYRHPDQVGDGIGELELPPYAQSGNRSGGYRMPGEDPGIGLYYGEHVARIEFVSQPGLYDNGERTVLEATLARLGTDRNVIAFWVPPLDQTALAPEDRHDDFALRAYDADGDVVKPDPRAVDPDSRFDPATAPQLGDLIRTGVDAGSGEEMVVAFRGTNGWAGLVLGL